MYVCVCNAITDKQIRRAVKSGAQSLRDLQVELGVASGCGSCEETATQILREGRQGGRPADPVVYQPALA